jgi:hypothetical protein
VHAAIQTDVIDQIIPIPWSNAVPKAAPKSLYLFSCFHDAVRDEMVKQQPSLLRLILQESKRAGS